MGRDLRSRRAAWAALTVAAALVTWGSLQMAGNDDDQPSALDASRTVGSSDAASDAPAAPTIAGAPAGSTPQSTGGLSRGGRPLQGPDENAGPLPQPTNPPPIGALLPGPESAIESMSASEPDDGAVVAVGPTESVTLPPVTLPPVTSLAPTEPPAAPHHSEPRAAQPHPAPPRVSHPSVDPGHVARRPPEPPARPVPVVLAPVDPGPEPQPRPTPPPLAPAPSRITPSPAAALAPTPAAGAPPAPRTTPAEPVAPEPTPQPSGLPAAPALPVETPPVETPPVQAPSVETPPVVVPPVDPPPVQAPPVETPPVVVPPVDPPPCPPVVPGVTGPVDRVPKNEVKQRGKATRAASDQLARWRSRATDKDHLAEQAQRRRQEAEKVQTAWRQSQRDAEQPAPGQSATPEAPAVADVAAQATPPERGSPGRGRHRAPGPAIGPDGMAVPADAGPEALPATG